MRVHACTLVLLVAALPACGRRATAAEPAFGPVPVAATKLAEQPVSDFDEYLASLTSRRSITLFPQVAGYVAAIRAKPGEQVKSGELLVRIDARQAEAQLQSARQSLATKRANLAYAVQNDESSRELVRAGLLSQLDYEQRHSQRVAAEADVRAAEAQVSAQEQLVGYYAIAAPTDGVVGDVPVKIGDYVTPQTRITSVDQQKLVEVYVYVPVAKAGGVTPQTEIDVLAADGKIACRNEPTFVAPDVSVETQTVLVKTLCPNEGALRTAQVTKARMVWATRPGLVVPTTAVSRLAGQYFVFVVERGPRGAVARQRPVAVGTIQGNDYVVTSGLSPGDEIVVSNVQKMRDGAPIAPEAAKPG